MPSYEVTIKEVLIHTYTVDGADDEDGNFVEVKTKARAAEVAISDGGNWKPQNNSARVIKVEKQK